MVRVYTRSKYATAEDLEDGSLLLRASLEDTYFAAEVEMVVKVPDLEIASLKGDIRRAFNAQCRDALPLLQEVVGLRIGSGVNKTINDLVGGPDGCPKLADLVLECIDQVVLRFTLPSVAESLEVSDEDRLKGAKEMLKQNPRLIGSCIAFAEGSPLLEAIGIEK